MENEIMKCGPDGCAVDWNKLSESEPSWTAQRKLNTWLSGFEPMDYDAPGTSVREQGV